MRLLSLTNEHTSSRGFTVDDIAKWPVLRQRNAPRKSIVTALNRFVALQIAESPGVDSRGRRLYRVKNTTWANAYIEGDKEKPWITPNPHPQGATFLDHDDHRDHFDIIAPSEVIERVKRYCEKKNGQLTLRNKAFTLSINEQSGRGQLFVRAYWRSEVKKWLGDDFYASLILKEAQGQMRGDFCLPIDVKGQRFTIGGRPTQFSASHYPAQLDIRAAKGDDHIRDGLLALTNQADFNTRMLDYMDGVLEVLKAQGNAITRIAEQFEQLLKAAGVAKGEGEYRPGVQEPNDYSYG